MNPGRRRFLVLAGSAPLAALAFAGAAEAAACYDPATLPLSQQSRRRALGYVDLSPDKVKHCGACAFFTAKNPGCGTCTLLSGGPVNAAGVCRSFAPKAK
ncbi:MAG: high-potential iron-sulfur protein [Novosphingobium sp.]